jgi:hypothetical protein
VFASPHDASDAITIGKQEFSEIAAILARDARDKRGLSHPGSLKSAGYTNRESRRSRQKVVGGQWLVVGERSSIINH